MRARFVLVMTAAFILMYVGYQQITAQNLVTCPGLVQQAIDSVGDNCGGMDRNSACYGFSDVTANFSVAQPVNFFTQPSDRARLLELESLSTSPMVEAQEKWGIALLSVQANLPDTLPGQSVVFMLLGDTQVENAVTPDQAFQTGTTVNVALTIGADLYYEAKMDAQVVGSIPQGTALTADATDASGQWVRVVYRGVPGWITRQVLTTDGDLGALPVIGPDTKTPMQAFYFRTGISGTQCTEAPNALVVQGPESLTVDINVNGADVRLGSTVVFYLLPVDAETLQYLISQYGEVGAISRLMQIVVLDGHVLLNAGTPDEIELNTGETTFICLNEPENLGADGQSNDQTVFSACPWAPPRPVTVEDLERFRDLEGVTLNYPIELPLALPTITPTPSDTPISSGGIILPTATFTPTFTPTNTLPPPPAPGQPTWTPSIVPSPTDTVQATFTPTYTFTPTPTDTPQCDPIPDPAGDVPTLIAAINAANDEICHPGLDTITLAGEGSYGFSAVDNNTDGANALPSITSAITINGAGSFIYNLDVLARYFHISAGGSLTLNSLNIQGGSATGGSGGAIYNAGTLALNFVTMDNNSADNGGAIYNGGSLTVTNSSIGSNGEGGNNAQNGGGIYTTGTANINASTIAYNFGTNAGGGIYNTGTLTTLNSTISSNGSELAGSGIYNAGGTSTLNFTTIFENFGGGAALQVAGGSASARNVIVGGSGAACSGSVAGQGTNLADDTSCGGFVTAGQLGVNGLGFYGGSTQTNSLDPASPAVDGGDCTTTGGGSIDVDQRGVFRPQDNTGSGMGSCDVGAFELESQF
ncbi:MAG: choice-of-anchor Q domain-containing protein [Anaerolineae bacterium]